MATNELHLISVTVNVPVPTIVILDVDFIVNIIISKNISF